MPPTRLEDDDSADESDMISTRTLALTRYKRNHEFMNEVFMYAAFSTSCTFSPSLRKYDPQSARVGRKKEFPPPKPPYSIFDKTEVEARVVCLHSVGQSHLVTDRQHQATLQAEIDELRSKADARREARSQAEGAVDEPGDVSMDVADEVAT